MVQSTEAIYTNGAFKPTGSVHIREGQRVRITIESLELPTAQDRAAAMQRLREGIERMNFRSNGPLPTRDELHERR